MTTIIFVHGTGGRREDYHADLETIQDNLSNIVVPKLGTNINLVECLWGEKEGVKPPDTWTSIPLGKHEPRPQLTDEQKFWAALEDNPVCELEAYKPPRGKRISPSLCNGFKQSVEKVEHLQSNTLLDILRSTSISEYRFNSVYTGLLKSDEYKAFSEKVSNIQESHRIFSYALVASIVKSVSFYITPEDRNSLAREITANLDNKLPSESADYGLPDSWMNLGLNVGFNLVIKGANYWLDRSRACTTKSEKAYPKIGDILYYQSKGDKIRDFIEKTVSEVKDENIILLAHSLGGIACFEMLVETHIANIKKLITVGSQVSFLYELDVLRNLPREQKLPLHFPEWLNIYDSSDILSYICEQTFYGSQSIVHDERVDNGEIFPNSHISYWKNSQVWESIAKHIARL